MAKSFDTGPLPMKAAAVTLLLQTALGVTAEHTSYSFGNLRLISYVIRVDGLDGAKMELRIRSEGGKARILIDMFMQPPPV